MPNSKRRKRHVASNKKQLERARRRIEAQTQSEANKENATSTTTTSFNSGFLREYRGSSGKQVVSESIEGERHRSIDQQSDVYESTSGPGWFGGLYNWCHSGLAQVVIYSYYTVSQK